MIKKIIILLLIISSMLCFTGCKIKIFEEKKSPYAIKDVDVSDLAQNRFYVKNGTKFQEVVNPESNFNSAANGVDNKRVIWLFGDEESIPTLYKGEIIAYASSSTSSIKGVSLERFRDVGYSFGFYNGSFDGDGRFCFNGSQSVNQSNANSNFGKTKEYVRIDTINDQKVVKDMINPAGCIVGLEPFGKYEVSYYIGTYYEEAVWTANSHVLQAFEYYVTTKITQTKNGYLQIELPDDLKSGYYLINGSGLFKYINQEKGSIENEKTIDMNEPYSETVEETTNKEDTVQEFGVFINSKKTNMTFTVFFTPDKSKKAEAILISPSGQEYNMAPNYEEGVFASSLTEVIQGEWLIKVMPATVVVNNITCKKTVYDTENEVENLNEETVEVVMEEAATNRLLKVEYAGIMPESAVVIAPDGKSYRLTMVEDNVLGYNFPYAREGSYMIHIYYKEDFQLKKAYMYDNSDYETEIITVIQ